jgi:hypothetical protein
VIDGKIEQHVCIKSCVKLGKSATETLEMLREASGEHSLSLTAVFEKFENSSTKTVAKQSMSSQTLL